MSDNTIFINDTLTEAFNLYKESLDNKESLNYNSFLCTVVRMLVIIYGEDVYKSFVMKDELGFNTIMMKYGYDPNELNNFKIIVDKYNNFNKKIAKKAIKKKNKYFNLVQKSLIDMFVKKIAKEDVNNIVKSEFYELLFTVNSKDFYRKSTAVLLAYNPYEIDEYAKKVGIVG